jgi:hypothetical protein
MNNKVKKAIEHVKSNYPTLKIVIFTNFGWQYMNEEFESFSFDERINVTILEEAYDSLNKLPQVFEVE